MRAGAEHGLGIDAVSEGGVSATTALRWITKLEQSGWLMRIANPLDDRQDLVELTPAASAQLRSYFASVWPTLLPL